MVSLNLLRSIPSHNTSSVLDTRIVVRLEMSFLKSLFYLFGVIGFSKTNFEKMIWLEEDHKHEKWSSKKQNSITKKSHMVLQKRGASDTIRCEVWTDGSALQKRERNRGKTWPESSAKTSRRSFQRYFGTKPEGLLDDGLQFDSSAMKKDPVRIFRNRFYILKDHVPLQDIYISQAWNCLLHHLRALKRATKSSCYLEV